MTREEIRKFLDNTKVYVNGKSKEIQEKLFSFGYKWYGFNPTKVSDENKPFLFIHDNGEINYSSEMLTFKEHENREITAEQILSLEEPAYRPFKNSKECWQEMLKHNPFGWLTQKGGGYFNPKVVCDKGVMIFVDGDYFPFIHAFDLFLFADGTPFGIKED